VPEIFDVIVGAAYEMFPFSHSLGRKQKFEC
jgi:hypothetical protein